jgi:hypothetical protein
MFSLNFNIIGVVARELHLLKIEGVEVLFFPSNLVKIKFNFETYLLISKIKIYKIL